jgi:hypothetical protein
MVGMVDEKSQIDKIYKCKKCQKIVVYRVKTQEREIKNIPKRTCSSGMTFL